MYASPDEMLAEAAAVYSSDPGKHVRASPERGGGSPSVAWSKAHMDLASHDFDHGNYAGVIEHASLVLYDNIRVVVPIREREPLRGVMLCSELSSNGQPINEALRRDECEEAAEANNVPYYAAVGFSHLARLHLERGRARPKARGCLEHAVDLYECALSMVPPEPCTC